MNQYSSRSHLILTFNILQKFKDIQGNKKVISSNNLSYTKQLIRD